MKDTVTDQVMSIQQRAELDRLLDNFEYVYGRFAGLIIPDGVSPGDALRIRVMDYAWTALVQAKLFEPNPAPPDKIVVMEHGAHE